MAFHAETASQRLALDYEAWRRFLADHDVVYLWSADRAVVKRRHPGTTGMRPEPVASAETIESPKDSQAGTVSQEMKEPTKRRGEVSRLQD